MCRPTLAVTLLASGLLAGCSEPSHLVHYHKTVVGLSASASAEGSAHLGLAYSQKHTALVPKTDIGADGKPSYEAMSVLFCTDVQNGFWGPLYFKENLATGDAAVAYAQGFADHPADSPFSCFQEGK